MAAPLEAGAGGFGIAGGCLMLPCCWLLTFSLFALITGGCNRHSVQNQPVRIVVAGTPSNLAFLPHTLAQELRLYEKAGLTLAVDAVPGGTKGLQSLIGGSADVVVGYYDHSVRMAAQGQAIRSFVTMTRYPGNVIVLSPAASQSKRTIEDLKNSLIGVSDQWSQSHLFLNYVLIRHGILPADVRAITTGTQPAALASLEHGKLDAWSGFDPGVTQMQKRHPSVRVLVDARSEKGVRETFGVDAYPGSVLYTRADWLQRNPAIAGQLARAIQSSLRWIHEHSPDQIMERVSAAYTGEDRTAYREALVSSMAMYSVDGRMPAQGPKAVRKALAASLENVRTAQIDLARTYTNEFLANQ
jgi:NitT/TauT family transport system substrate-binding protein